jgi:putative ABC transport system substrate-binding protein
MRILLPFFSTAERSGLLRQLVFGLHRLAVIVRDDPGLDQKLQDIRSDAQRKGIEVLMLEATTAKALELAFARLRADRCQAIYVASGPLGPIERARIIALAADSRLPAIYSFRIFPVEGGLMSFAADYGDLFGRAAGFVDRILKGAMIEETVGRLSGARLTLSPQRVTAALGTELPTRDVRVSV